MNQMNLNEEEEKNTNNRIVVTCLLENLLWFKQVNNCRMKEDRVQSKAWTLLLACLKKMIHVMVSY